MLDSLKNQTILTINKILDLISKELIKEGEKNFVNIKQILNNFSEQLNTQENIVLGLILSNELEKQINLGQFQGLLKKIKEELEFDNQFKVSQQKIEDKLNIKANRKRKLVKYKYVSSSSQKNPQISQISKDLCLKLFQMYRKVDNSKKQLHLSFEDKQLFKSSMSYDKIIEIFKQTNIKLEIFHRIQILRIIKKISINPQFINKEQFIQILKKIVHDVGFPQEEFQKIIINRYQKGRQFKELTQIKDSRRTSQKRYTKMKTQSSILDPIKTGILRKKLQINNKVIRNNNSHKLPKDLPRKLSKIEKDKNFNRKKNSNNQIQKVSWQSLFKITQATRPRNIQIPKFIYGKLQD